MEATAKKTSSMFSGARLLFFKLCMAPESTHETCCTARAVDYPNRTVWMSSVIGDTLSVKAEGQTLSNVILHNVNQRCKSSPDWKSPIPNKITLKKQTKKTKLFILLQVAKQETRFLRQIIPQQSKEYIHTSPKAHPAMWAYIENESSKSPNRVWVMNCINVMHL